jgi:hypothetical protein
MQVVPHSLDKLWRSHLHGCLDGVQPRPRKAGKPALGWTPAREEALYRLIAKGIVPMKDIAIAMRELAVPAGLDGPGQPEFAPWYVPSLLIQQTEADISCLSASLAVEPIGTK